MKFTPRHYAYLKISEGCDNSCSFCIIPHLRGPLVSRPAADVLREAEKLVKAGVKELIVISQDTSAYGRDLRYAESVYREAGPARFLDLARALGDFGAWVRLHYVYPYPHVDEVLALMAEGRALPYLDIPFQHAAPSVLKAMRRPAMRRRFWSASAPGVRPARISRCARPSSSAFPARRRRISAYLLDWLEEAEVERVGAFKYEPVAGAPANDLGLPLVPDEIKESRWNRFMARQQAISARMLKRKVGKRLYVIIDEGRRRARPPRAAAKATRRASTARCISRRTDRYAQARSSA